MATAFLILFFCLGIVCAGLVTGFLVARASANKPKDHYFWDEK